MNPALSVIIFTVLSGAGFGLFTLTAVLDALTGGSFLTTNGLLAASVTGVALAVVGLLASTLHLANPKNAWRAFFRFRTSWLSREGVFSVLFFPFALPYVAGVWLQGDQRGATVAVLGLAAALLALATVFCTGMIYASLRTIRQWNTSLVPVNYVLLSLATGALALLPIHLFAGTGTGPVLAGLCLTLVLVAALGKASYFFWIGQPKGPSINTATTMTRGQVRLLEAGQSSPNFTTREFNYQAPVKRLRRFRLGVYLLGFAVPLLLVGWSWQHDSTSAILAALAALVSSLVGIAMERWLFFAEARHVVNLFYGRQQC